MEKLKKGITTGSCASAGVQIALENIFLNISRKELDILSLSNELLRVEVSSTKSWSNRARVAIRKDAGDDPDVTNGIKICVSVTYLPTNLFNNYISSRGKMGYLKDKILLIGGRGVGVTTKKGLQVPVGKYAINPGPQKMIFAITEKFFKDNNLEFQLDHGGIVIKIFVPEGITKSKYTLNKKLGITNGISILGTTGIVKPMSEESLKDSLFAELKVIAEDTKKDWAIFAFGNYGERFCISQGLTKDSIVIISNYIGFMLDSAVELGFKKIILVGHIGKAVKIAGGIFNTHSRVADARMEIMAANAFLFNEKNSVIEKILLSNTVDEACEYIENKDFFMELSNKIARRCNEYSRDKLQCEAMVFSFKGETLGHSENFYKLISNILKEE